MKAIQTSIDKWMDKEDIVYLYWRILLNHNKEIMPFSTTWMDLEIITLNELGQRKTNINIHHLFVEFIQYCKVKKRKKKKDRKKERKYPTVNRCYKLEKKQTNFFTKHT